MLVFRSSLNPILHDYRTVQFSSRRWMRGKRADLLYELINHQGPQRRSRTNNVTSLENRVQVKIRSMRRSDCRVGPSLQAGWAFLIVLSVVMLFGAAPFVLGAAMSIFRRYQIAIACSSPFTTVKTFTLVREIRKVTFKRRAVNPLQFSWANTLIDPTSVELKFSRTSAEKLDVLDTILPAGQASRCFTGNRAQSDFDGEATIEITYFTSGHHLGSRLSVHREQGRGA